MFELRFTYAMALSCALMAFGCASSTVSPEKKAVTTSHLDDGDDDDDDDGPFAVGQSPGDDIFASNDGNDTSQTPFDPNSSNPDSTSPSQPSSGGDDNTSPFQQPPDQNDASDQPSTQCTFMSCMHQGNQAFLCDHDGNWVQVSSLSPSCR